jgi:carboxyl-terminal processing protease
MSPRTLIIAALTLLLTGARAQTVDGKPEIKQQVLERVTKLIESNAFVPGIDFSRWAGFLEQEKEKLDAAKNDEEFQRAINEALRKFGASHCVLTTPKTTEILRTGKTVGIGISGQSTPEGIVIVRTAPGGSAEKLGLLVGDTIVEADGKKPDGARALAGEEGTTVKLKIKHANGETDTYEAVRKPFSTLQEEEISFPSEQVARLAIHSFDFTYNPERVEDLLGKIGNRTNLILDLRDNPGGAVVNLQHLLGLLMPADAPIGTFISRRLTDRYVKETNGSPTDITAIAAWAQNKLKPAAKPNVARFRGQVAVLINSGSGSASEMVAAALKDTINATIIGRKSAGAVLVSIIVPASNGFMLQYPLSDYVTIKGVRLEGTGVTPDFVVDEPRLRLPNKPDLTLQKALEVLRAEPQRSNSSAETGARYL